MQPINMDTSRFLPPRSKKAIEQRGAGGTGEDPRPPIRELLQRLDLTREQFAQKDGVTFRNPEPRENG